MNNFKKRIKRRIDMTIITFKKDCRISLKLAFLRMVDDLSSRRRLKKTSRFFHSKKDGFILKYLEKILVDSIEMYRDNQYCGEYSANSPIWICWWTGEETAPALVKKCIKSIRKNSGDHPVNLITGNNYMKYIDIPNFILDHLKNGNLSIANFTDYLRFSLLEKYGGLWLDSTIYVATSIPESYFTESLFTCKSQEIECGYISRYRWTSFCFGGWKNNVLFKFFKDSFEEYWNNHDVAIDYLFVDYLIDIANRNIYAVKKQIESVPLNNPHRDDLRSAMNKALPAREFKNIIQPQTVLYKLSWRETYSLQTVDGDSSIYDYYLRMD